MPFEGVLGQERVVRVLRKALASGTLPHAYLFYGPRGVGRFETACALAQALLCPNGRLDACGTCLDCQRVDQEKGEKKEEQRCHPDFLVLRPLVKVEEDLFEVDPERGEIRIHQVRELERWLSVRSFHGGWRVCVFDGAEKINDNAANALLKTLEEPPPQSLLILIAAGRTQLPPTIQSRCQPLCFQALPPGEIERFLAARVPAGREDLALVAVLSDGSLGRALGALDEDRAWFFEERGQWLRRFLMLFESGNRESLVGFAEDLAGSARLADVLDLLVIWYRDLVVFGGTRDAGRVLNRDQLQQVEAWSNRWDAPRLAEHLKVIRKAKGDIVRGRLNARLVLEGMVLRLLDGGRREAPPAVAGAL